jgi:type IV secretory pathway protease TraF
MMTRSINGRRSILDKVVRRSALTVVALLVLVGMMFAFGRNRIAINVTPSAPEGFYWRTNDPSAPYAVFCLSGPAKVDARSHGLDAPGMCPDHSFPFMKHIYRPDQITAFTQQGFYDRDGNPINLTAPKPFAFDGRPLRHIPFGKVFAPEGTFWAISNHGDGYDSRYFGPIEKKQILFLAKQIPLLTF